MIPTWPASFQVTGLTVLRSIQTRYASRVAAQPDSKAKNPHSYPVLTENYKTHQGRKFQLHPNISTLDPTKLVESDYASFSNKAYLILRYQRAAVIYTHYARFTTRVGENEKRVRLHRFPQGTEGYLYLHRYPGVHPAASSLRFRICKKHLPVQEAFSQGDDLPSPTGSPWNLSLLRFAVSTRQSINVEATLERDGLVSSKLVRQMEDLIDACKNGTGYIGFNGRHEKQARQKIHFTSPHVFSFRQPFDFVVDHETCALNVVDLERQVIQKCSIFSGISQYSALFQLDNHAKIGSMWIEYNEQEDRMMLRILRIPKIFHGKTRYNEGDIFPLTFLGKYGVSVKETLQRQSF